MTDYNDGKWYGWNGGEFPVHPLTTVQCAMFDEYMSEDQADSYDWKADGNQNPIIAFRVTKEHKEPREFWISNNDGFAHDSLDSVLSDPLTEKHGYTHVREVTK